MGVKEASPQSLYSLLPARMATVKNFKARLDLREDETRVLSPAIPPSCNSRPAAPSRASLSLQVPSMLSLVDPGDIDAVVPAAHPCD